MESWQSGNAADSKSADPVHPGAQVQILYSPYNNLYEYQNRFPSKG